MTVEEASSNPFSFEETINLVMKRDYQGLVRAIKMDGFDINKADFRGATALHYAAELDDVELIEIITSHPKLILNPKTIEMASTPLMIAAGNGKSRALKCLVGKGADVSCMNEHCYTALMLAAEAQNLECVDILLEADRSCTHFTNFNQRTALQLGIRSLEIVERLIKVSDLNQVDGEGYTVLHYACEHAPAKVVQLILDQNVLGVNVRSFENETPLHIAIMHGRMEIADLLIQNGASLSAVGEGGSAYECAAIYDKSESFLEKYEIANESHAPGLLLRLAENGRAKTLKRYLSKLALHYSKRRDIVKMAFYAAAKGGHVDCMKLLFPDSIDGNMFVQAIIFSVMGSHFACFEFSYTELLKLDNGEELIEDNKENVLEMAFSSGNAEICNFLLDQGICPDGDDETTYLMMACGQNNLKLVETLLSHGADVDRTHSKYGGALILAASNNNLKIVKLLLKHGANPSVQDAEGFTPFLAAAFFGCADVFFELLALESNVNSRSIYKRTPLLAACSGCNMEIVKALVDKGACLTDLDDCNDNCLHLAALNKENGLNVMLFLFEKLGDNFSSMIVAHDSTGSSPLEYVLKHKDQKMLFSLLAVKPELSDHLDAPININVDIKIHTDHDGMCLICRDDFAIGDAATKLPCRHLFHEHCYSEWWLLNPNCPYCQRFPFRLKH